MGFDRGFLTLLLGTSAGRAKLRRSKIYFGEGEISGNSSWRLEKFGVGACKLLDYLKFNRHNLIWYV